MNKHGASETKIKPALQKPNYTINSDRLPILSIKNQFLPTPVLLTLQKPKSLLSSPIIQQSTKNLRLMHKINPVNKSHSSSSSSESQKLMKRLQSGKQSKNMPELIILKPNEDKQSYLKKPIIRESLVGEQAIQKFYQRYKQSDRRRQKEDFMNEKHAITKIINLLQIHNFTPRKLTLVKLKGKQAMLDLKKLGLGQGSMGPVIVQIVNYLEYFQEVDLSYNRIDGLLGQSIIQKLGKVKKIDLSHNRIGKTGCQKISELFLLSRTKIQQLNLEQNNLLDNAGVILLQQLAQYNNLKKLNLNKNYMGLKFALKLKELLRCDKELNELYLSWNQFSFKAIRAILQGVAENTNLKVLDFSWNRIEEENIPILVKIFKDNSSLKHVDFSFCQIKLKSISSLAQALNENHTLYGLHFEGNSGFIDHRGFLNGTEKQFNEYPLPLIKGVIRKIDGIKPNLINQFKGGHLRDVCWICHSWQQKYFDIAFSQELQQEVKSINGTIECYIHFRHQNFRAVRMMLNEKGNRFQIARMCPIGYIYFFFTFFLSNGARRVVINNQYHSVLEQKLLNYCIGKIEIKQTVFSQNHWVSEYELDPLDEFYEPKIHIFPRFSQIGINYRQTQKVLLKRKVFREEKVKVNLKNLDGEDDDFLKDKQNRDFDEVIHLLFRLFLCYIGIFGLIQEYLKKCIDFDIENSKIAKIIKDQSKLQQFKSLMIKYYRYFKEAFYYLSRGNPAQTGIYSVNQLQFVAFLEEQKYITKRVTLPKIMLKLYSCLSAGEEEEIKANRSKNIQKKGEDKNINKLISRPQFLQFLIRLAIQKWCTFKQVKKKKEEVNPDNLWDLGNKKSQTIQKNNRKREKNDKVPIQIKLQKKQEQITQKIEGKDQEEQQQENEMNKLKMKLPLPLIEGIQKTISSLKRYVDNYGSSLWRQQKYLKLDVLIVLKAYQEFLYNLYEKYTEAKFKTSKPKKIINLLTLEELKTLMLDTEIKRTKQAMKQVDQAFLDCKRLQVEDGSLQFGLTFQQFQQCLARLSDVIWFSPVASSPDNFWEEEVNRRNTPLFLRFQSLIVAMYQKLPQLHNKRMDKIADKGIFELQIELILDKIQRLSQRTTNIGLLRRNSILGEQSISLKDVIDQLRQKYDKMVVQREQQQQFFEDAFIQA